VSDGASRADGASSSDGAASLDAAHKDGSSSVDAGPPRISCKDAQYGHVVAQRVPHAEAHGGHGRVILQRLHDAVETLGCGYGSCPLPGKDLKRYFTRCGCSGRRMAKGRRAAVVARKSLG
jgi:hypothetical protein